MDEQRLVEKCSRYEKEFVNIFAKLNELSQQKRMSRAAREAMKVLRLKAEQQRALLEKERKKLGKTSERRESKECENCECDGPRSITDNDDIHKKTFVPPSDDVLLLNDAVVHDNSTISDSVKKEQREKLDDEFSSKISTASPQKKRKYFCRRFMGLSACCLGKKRDL